MVPKKFTKKLVNKKNRLETGMFLVEGKKNILELLSSDFKIETIYGTTFFINELAVLLSKSNTENIHETRRLITVTESELEHMGTLKSNNAGIAIVFQKIKLQEDTFLEAAKSEIVLVLDDVRDPGNFGTIIRTADWFGVTHIVTSETTTDFYNPKTIAASMGSFTRVSVTSLPLPEFLKSAHLLKIPITGAVLNGKNLYESKLPTHGVLLMGSESHGIHETLLPFITESLAIPRHGNAESLNVGVATGILLASIRNK